PHLLVFLTDTPTTEISTLSLHDALPIYAALATRAHPHLACPAHAQPAAFDRHPASGEHLVVRRVQAGGLEVQRHRRQPLERGRGDRKSTRLNSSHVKISYAVFCLKKKNK